LHPAHRHLPTPPSTALLFFFSPQVDDYDLLSISSEVPEYPASNLVEGVKKGWLAEGREASILLHFPSPIHLSSVLLRVTDACPVQISLYVEGQSTERESYMSGAPRSDGRLGSCVLVRFDHETSRSHAASAAQRSQLRSANHLPIEIESAVCVLLEVCVLFEERARPF
tara:strand:- start:82 stop:588 length:507 start_codon:yes stop_codon:yes gene_type:complete